MYFSLVCTVMRIDCTSIKFFYAKTFCSSLSSSTDVKVL